MAASRRLVKELADIKAAELKSYEVSLPDEKNILQWRILLKPESPPYNKGAFRIQINFPAEYPFKPPKIQFLTKIYHPNVDDNGQICLPIISPEHWKPATKSKTVMESLMALIQCPEPEHPLRGELAEEFTKDRKKFDKAADEYTKKHAEKRPYS